MGPKILLAGFCCATSLFMAGNSFAAGTPSQVTEQQIQHLTDLVVETMPMGEIMDHSIAADPTWPLKQKASRVSAEQLRCLRDQLSSASYRAAKLKEVRAFAGLHANEVADDTKVLDDGAAQVSNRLVLGGARAHEMGAPPNPGKDLQSITGSEMIAYTSYEYDPKYADLRNLTGIGDANDPAKPADERHQAMAAKMLVLNMDTMYRAMDACHIPPATML